MTHTKDLLADALLAADLGEMAAKAREGYYHDFLSPLITPMLQLAHDLAIASTPAAAALRKRVINGDFDTTSDEAEAWADSEEGRNALGKLTEGKK
jgi:hypothetical protein